MRISPASSAAAGIGRLSCALLVALLAGACSPALDWREVRPEDSRAAAMFPCKPTAQARRVQLDGQEVRMALHVCSSGDQSWALAFADVGDPARVAPALEALQASAAVNLDATPPPRQPLVVRGATPNPASTRQRLRGLRPDGQAVEMASAVFAYGTVVYQASVLGAALDDEALETYFAGLRVGG